VQAKELTTNDKNGPGWMLLGLCEAKIGAREDARSHLHKADSLFSGDIDSQLYKARALETLGQRDAALATLTSCLRRGASTIQVDLMPEMGNLQADPRYREILETLPPIRTM
jgi:tetratricopeptide (TPR) repeat protein